MVASRVGFCVLFSESDMDRTELALDYNWSAAFEFTGWVPPEGESTKTNAKWQNAAPVWCVADDRKDTIAPFGPEEVAEVIAYSLGEHDAQNWLLVGRLDNGLFFFLDAGCDYTGWDCQSSGTATVSTSIDTLVAFALDDEQRERLGLQRRVA